MNPQHLTDQEVGFGAPAAGSSKSKADNKYLSDVEAGFEPPSRGFKGWVGDALGVAARGAISVPEAAVGLLDIPTGGAVGKALENEGGSVGLRFKQAKEAASDLFDSDATKQQNQQFQQADGIVEKAKVALSNPSMVVRAVGESLPAMGAGGVASRGLMAATKLGQMGTAGAALAGAAGEGITMAGSAAEQIRQETPDGLLTPTQSGLAAATGVAGAAIGALGGRVAQKLGIGDAETLLAQGTKGMAKANADDAARAAVNPLVQQQAAKSIPRRVVEGAIAEGFLEELPQSVAEQVFQNVALGKDWLTDVDAAVVMGVLSGSAMGGAAAGYHGFRQPKAGEPGAAPGNAQPAGGEQPGAAVRNPGMDRIQQAFADQLSALQQQEQGDPAVPQTTPPDGAAALAQQQAQAAAQRQAAIDASRAVQSPDDEIYQSTGATVPRSVAMGLDPAAGPLSASAALAVDSGASDQVQQATALAQAAEAAQKQGKKPAKSNQKQEQQSIAQQGVNAETGEISQGSAMEGWSDAQLSDTFRGAQSREVRMQLAQELGRRRALREQQELQAELDAEQRATVPGADRADAAFASLTEDAGPVPADLTIPATTEGKSNGPQAAQAQQDRAQPSQVGAAPAVARGATDAQGRPGANGAQQSAAAGLTDGAQAENLGAQAAAAASAQAAPQAEDTAQRVARTGDAWTRMPTAERQALADRADLNPIVKKNVPRAAWGDLNRDVQRKLADAMAPQAVPALAPEQIAIAATAGDGKPRSVQVPAQKAKAEQGINPRVPPENRASQSSAAAEKEPWQMTAMEFSQQEKGNPHWNQSYAGKDDGAYLADTYATHARLVQEAVAAGKLDTPQGSNAPSDFIPAPDGGLDYGEITPDMGKAMRRQAGKIRLRRGDETQGLVHIEARHAKDFAALGFESAQHFVAQVAEGFTKIYKGRGAALDVVLDDQARGMLIVSLEPSVDGDFYDIKTATPIRRDQFKNEEPLWERAGPSASTAVEGSPPYPKGQNGSDSVAQPPATAQPITTADITAARQQAADLIGAAIDAMPAGDVNRIAKKFLPTMGLTPTASKARNKAAMTDQKVNLQAAAAEVGVTLPAEVKRSLDAEMEGRVADGSQEPAAKAPVATDLTPKQFHEAKLSFIAADTGTPLSEVRENYDTEAGRAEHDREWAAAVEAAAQRGEVLTRQTLDKLLELNPNVRLPESAIPEGYQRPEARKAEAEEKLARVANRKAAKSDATTIADAGEKIGGARKDRWKERGLNLDDLDAMSESEGAELAAKANVWKPDYDALAEASEPVTAAMVKVIYDRLAAKPGKNTPEGRRQFVKMMQIVRQVYTEAKGPEAVRTAYLKVRELAGLNTADPAAKAAARELLFSVYKGRSDPFTLGYSELSKAKKMVADGFPAKADPWKTRLVVGRAEGGPGTTERGVEIYMERSAEVGTPLTREQILDGFYRVNTKDNKTVAFAPTKADAEAAAATVYERDIKGKKDGKPEPVRPNLDELKRENLPQRIDRDVTSEDFIRDLGFRGVEFGNWSAQDERQRILNMAYDGLMDLAEIMGVPPKAMSLNGTLGMAFGARGGGRFAAHYEPGKLVINMTKIRGGGSMAHEWAHALDHYFGELDKADAYTTKARGASGWYSEDQYLGVPRKRMERVGNEWVNVEKMRLDNLRPEMAAAFDEVMRALFSKQITKAEMVRSHELDLERTEALVRNEQQADLKAMYQNMAQNKRQALNELRNDPEGTMYAGRGRSDFASQAQALSGKATDGYWVRPTEMFARAFESWVFDRVTAMGARSDYLVHGVEEDRFAGGAYKGNPYPTGEERARINAAFDKLAATVQTKETDKGVAMYRAPDSAAPARPLSLDRVNQLVQEALAGIRGAPPVEVAVRPSDIGLQPPPGSVGYGVTLSSGDIYVFQSAMASDMDVFRTVFHELFHRGVRVLVPKAQYVQTMLDLAKGDSRIQQLAIEWKNTEMGQKQKDNLRERGYTGAELTAQYEALAIEEALAAVAEEIKAEGKLGSKPKSITIRFLANWLAKVADLVGMKKLAQHIRAMTYNEAERFVMSAIDRSGEPVPRAGVNNMRSEDAEAGDGTPGDAPAFRREEEGRATPFDVSAFLKARGRPSAYSEAAQRQAIDSVSATVDAIRSAWGPNAPEVVVAFDMQDQRIPEAARRADLRQRSGGARGAPEGFYYEGKAYLMASRLNTPNDAARVLYHEVLGHHGLRGKFGSDLDQVLNQIATMRKAEVAAKMQEYGLRGVNRLSVREAAEEVLAEMAEKNPRLPFVQRAISAIRNFLRQHVPGFQSLRLTDNDIIQAYILPARGWVERGARAVTSEAEPVFAVNFARHPGFSAAVDAAVKAGTTGAPGVRGHVEIGTLPPALAAAGVPAGDLKTSAKVLQKVVFDHGVPPSVVKRIPELLERPVMVFRSATVEGSFVAVTSEMVRGAPLIVAISPETTRGAVALNFVPSLYPRDDLQAIQRWLNATKPGEQLLTYLDKEQSPAWFGSTRLQLPGEYRTAQGLQSRSVKTEADAVNGDVGGEALFSRSKLQDIKVSALDQFQQAMSHEGKVSLWDKTVGTMRNLGERSPAFKPVYEAAQRFIDDVSMLGNDAADRAPRLLPRVETLADLKKKPITAADNQAVAKPLFEGTLLWARDVDGTPVTTEALNAKYRNSTPDEKAQILLRTGKIQEQMLKVWRGLPVDQYNTIINNKFDSTILKPGVVWTEKELKELFGLSAQQVSLYQEARAAIDRSIDMTARADMLRALGNGYADLREAVLAQATAEDAMVLITDTLQAEARENPDQADRVLSLNNAVVKSHERAQALMDAGYAPLSRFGRYTVDVVGKDGTREYFGMFESMYESNKMKAAMEKEFPGATVTQGTMSDEAFKLFQGVTPESLEHFGQMLGLSGEGTDPKDKAFQAYLQLAKNNHSALKRLIHRKGISGYSEDVGRVLASFVYSNARLAAGGLNAGTLETAIEGIPKEQGELRDVAMGLRSYIQDPQEEGQAVRGMLFAQYLGGSVASAVVNMTQPFQITMPWLSQYGGMRSAASHLAGAVRDMTRRSAYEPDLAKALHTAEAEGIVSPQEIHQLMAQARGTGSLRTGDGTKLGDARAAAANNWERVKVAWGQPFALAEQFNRRSTFIAAYRIAKEQGMADPAKFAERAVLETQFVYSKANKPKWARGAIGGTLFTFKTYSVSYLELMHRMWSQGGPEGKRAVGWAVAMLLLMGGAGGLPFMEDAEDLIDGAGQLMGYNVSTKQWRKQALRDVVGKELADFVENGVSGLPGAPIDVSGRLGMGNLIPGTGLLLSKQSRERDLLEVAGPAGDLVARGFTGARKLLTGDVAGAALEVSPTAVRNAAKGIDMATSGIYKDTKGYKVIDTTLDEAVAKAIGFQPKSVAEVQEANSFMQRSKSFYTQTSSDIKAQWAQAVFEKDEAALQRVRDRLAAWNRNNPDQPIVVKIPDVMKRVREMGKDRTQRIADTAPKALRQQMRDMARETSQGPA